MKDQIWTNTRDIATEATGAGACRKILSYTDELMIVENHFEAGAVGALHSHPHTQIVYVPRGKFEFTVDGETRIIAEGDSVLVKGNIVHGCACLEPGILLDIFTPMREDFVK